MPLNTGPQFPTVGGYGSTPLPGSVRPPVTSGQQSTSQLNFSDIDWGGVGSSIVDFFKDHWQDLAKLGLATMTTVEAIKNSQSAANYTGKALDMAQQDYDSRGKFRDAAATKLAATRPDLSTVFADPGNPYKAVQRSIPAVGSGAPGPFVETPSVGGYNGPPQSGTVGGTPPPPLPVYRPPASGPIPRVGKKIAAGAY